MLLLHLDQFRIDICSRICIDQSLTVVDQLPLNIESYGSIAEQTPYQSEGGALFVIVSFDSSTMRNHGTPECPFTAKLPFPLIAFRQINVLPHGSHE